MWQFAEIHPWMFFILALVAIYAAGEAFGALALYWMTRPRKGYTTTEWREAMRRQKLGTK